MHKSYLVSIIVPVYNQKVHLEKCIESLISQTYQNIEIILVDDGSTDGSGIICDDYAQKDKRIIVIHKGNEGVTLARIDGVNSAKGEFLSFVDSDDYITPDCIEILVENQKKQDADVVAGQRYKGANGHFRLLPFTIIGDFDRNGIKHLLNTRFYYDPKIGEGGLNVGPHTKLYRKKYVLEGLKEGIGFWYGEDMLMNVHILQKIDRLTVIPNALYYYVLHENQVTKKDCYLLWDACCKLFQKIKEIDTINTRQHSFRIWREAQHYCSLALNQTKSTKELTRFTKYVFDSELVRENVFNNDKITEIIQGKKSQLKYFLLKNRLYWLYSIMVTCLYKLNNNEV